MTTVRNLPFFTIFGQKFTIFYHFTKIIYHFLPRLLGKVVVKMVNLLVLFNKTSKGCQKASKGFKFTIFYHFLPFLPFFTIFTIWSFFKKMVNLPFFYHFLGILPKSFFNFRGIKIHFFAYFYLWEKRNFLKNMEKNFL